MTKKELKRYAQKIADLETTIATNNDKEKVSKAKEQIFQLANKLSPEDMFAIDDLIRKILEKNS